MKQRMQFLAYRILLAMLSFFIESATVTLPASAAVGPLPSISHASTGLKRALRTVRKEIQVEAASCNATAVAMDTAAEYSASFEKTFENQKVLILRVFGDSMCDGMHPFSFQYGMAFEKTSGNKIDLNTIYNIGIWQNGRLFLRPELSDSIESSYRQKNRNIQTCFSDVNWKEQLTQLPISFAPDSNGSIFIYYDVPSVTKACFPAMLLPNNISRQFLDSNKASHYGLP